MNIANTAVLANTNDNAETSLKAAPIFARRATLSLAVKTRVRAGQEQSDKRS